MTDSNLSIGQVEITLDGRTLMLKPSLDAATMISKVYGGFEAAMMRVQALDQDAMVFIVGKGLGLSDRDMKALPRRVYEAGLQELRPPLMRFVSNLSNGGRPIRDDDDSGNAVAASG